MNILIIGIGSVSKKHIYSIQKTIKNPVIYGLRSNKLNCNTVKGVINIYNFKRDDRIDHIDIQKKYL